MSRISWAGLQGYDGVAPDHCDVSPRSSVSQKTPLLDNLVMVPPQPIPTEVMVKLAETDVGALATCVKSYYSAYHAYVRVMAGAPSGSAVSYSSFTSGGLSRDASGRVVSPWSLAAGAGDQRVGGLDSSLESGGHCYLQAFLDEHHDDLRSKLGVWPTLNQLLERPAVEFQIPSLEVLKASRVPGGWHFGLSAGGESALRLMRRVALEHSGDYPSFSLGGLFVGQPLAHVFSLPGLPPGLGDTEYARWTSSRPRDAVVASADTFEGRVRTVSDVCGTMDRMVDLLPSEVEPGSLLLASTPSGVAKLNSRYGAVPDVQILTIPQAQGLSCENVYLFKLGDVGEELWLSNTTWMSVAFTRHLRKFRYVSRGAPDYVHRRIELARQPQALSLVADVTSAGVANKL